MSRKYIISFKIKIKYVQEYLAGKKRLCDICEELSIAKESFRRWIINKVSYQQVYTWVRKYKYNGQESLIDKRGKSKTVKEMSDSQKIRAQIKLLEAKNKRLEIENDFLKKLE